MEFWTQTTLPWLKSKAEREPTVEFFEYFVEFFVEFWIRSNSGV